MAIDLREQIAKIAKFSCKGRLFIWTRQHERAGGQGAAGTSALGRDHLELHQNFLDAQAAADRSGQWLARRLLRVFARVLVQNEKGKAGNYDRPQSLAGCAHFTETWECSFRALAYILGNGRRLRQRLKSRTQR